MLSKLWSDEAGVTQVETAILAALVAVTAIAAWQGFGDGIATQVGGDADQLPTGPR